MRKQQIRCPRCGRPGTVFIKTIANNRYYMMYHGRDGKRQLVCYLGPVEKYKHASLAHTFPLRGLNYPEREGEYLLNLIDSLISLLMAAEVSEGQQNKALEVLTTAHMSIVRSFAEVLKELPNNNVLKGKILKHLKKVIILLIDVIGDGK